MLEVFFPAPLGWVYTCAKFHACFKNCTILVLCRSTISPHNAVKQIVSKRITIWSQ